MSQINWKDKCFVTTVYLVNDSLEVLLSWNKNMQTWIPVGGHLEVGDTPEEAIVREVKEETGFDFEFIPSETFENNGNVKVLSLHRIQIDNVPHHNKHINFVFIGKLKNYDKKVTETDEQEKLKWFSEEDLKNDPIMFESVRKVALEAIEKVRNS